MSRFSDTFFDVAIIGAGPAGTCAALRLLQLGHRVAIIEQQAFPRPQIGESLSPGIWTIFSYLNAEDLLKHTSYLKGLPAKVIWEFDKVVTMSAEQRGPGIMVDRSILDSDLLELCRSRGAKVFEQTSTGKKKYEDKVWSIQLKNNTVQSIHSTFILDARGRKGILAKDRILTAPPTVAMWLSVKGDALEKATLIEALEDAWLWGAPTVDGAFRVMAFVDVSAIARKKVPDCMKALLAKSKLFEPVHQLTNDDIQTCSVVSYCHQAPWKDQYIKIGESAFSLDPLSSTGTEKAMRFSLQTVTAIHTVLSKRGESIAQSFYTDRLVESVATHINWTSDYYAKAWSANLHSFWRDRSKVKQYEHESDQHSIEKALSDKLRSIAETPSPGEKQAISIRACLQTLWHQPVTVHPETSWVKTACIVGDHLEYRPALKHPNIHRAIAYLDGVELAPLFNQLNLNLTYGQLVQYWGQSISMKQAARLVVWLWEEGILVSERGKVARPLSFQ